MGVWSLSASLQGLSFSCWHQAASQCAAARASPHFILWSLCRDSPVPSSGRGGLPHSLLSCPLVSRWIATLSGTSCTPPTPPAGPLVASLTWPSKWPRGSSRYEEARNEYWHRANVWGGDPWPFPWLMGTHGGVYNLLCGSCRWLQALACAH